MAADYFLFSYPAECIFLSSLLNEWEACLDSPYGCCQDNTNKGSPTVE